MKRLVLALLLVFAFFSCKKADYPTLLDGNTDIENLEFQEGEESYRIYRFLYPSVDVAGKEVTLSATMIVPVPSEGMPFNTVTNVLMPCHVTLFDKSECPSLYVKTRKSEEMTAFLRMWKQLLILPDYEGYGVTADRPHPYVVRSVSGRQSADALLKGLELYRKLVAEQRAVPLDPGFKSLCMGYSQGAAVSLSVQEYLEKNGLNDDVHYSGSICGGSPVDLMATLKYYFTDDGDSYGVSTRHRIDRVFPPLTMPMIIKCYCDCLPGMQDCSPEDYFSKAFLDCGLMDWLEEGRYDTLTLIQMLYDNCRNGFKAKDGTEYSAAEAKKLFPVMESATRVEADLKEILTPQCYEWLRQRALSDDPYKLPEDETGPMAALGRAMLENSFLGGWTPIHRILFLHSKMDTLIPYGNIQSFIEKHPGAPVRTVIFSDNDHREAGRDFYMRQMLSPDDVNFIFAN